jgi:benzoate-CoA ligase
MTVNAATRLLRTGLDRWPGKDALLFQKTGITYAALDRMVRAAAAGLRSRNISPGERVAIRLPDSPAFVTAFLGAILCGAIPVPLGEAVPASDQDFIMRDSGASLLVTTAAEPGVPCLPCDLLGPLAPVAEGAHFTPHRPGPEDPAYILYTSGSTGRPKGVLHVHDDLLVPAATLGPWILGDTAADTILSASKLSFSYGLMAQIGLGLASGATVLLLPAPPDAKTLPAALLAARPTVFFAVPAVYDMLLRTMDDGVDLSFLRACVSSGETLPGVLHDAWRGRTGLHITEVIGSTETFTSFMAMRPGLDTPGTLGSAVPGFHTRLRSTADPMADPMADREAEDGEPGTLLVRGPGLARRYWRGTDADAPPLLRDGWLDTGDICIRTGRDTIHAGRTDDLFRSGGQWVLPGRVEDVLLTHPAVAQCAVVPCQVRGMTYARAFVVAADGDAGTELTGELIKYARKRLPRHMCPVVVTSTDTIPRTATGKVQRHKLINRD